MPRSQTGQFVEPGSSSAAYVAPLTEHDVAGLLDQLARDARVRENQNAERALQALSGTDPALFPISSTARPRVLGLLRRHQTELARIRSSEERKYMNQVGIARQEAEVRQQHAEELAGLEAELTGKLEHITRSLDEKLQTLRGGGVTEEEMNQTHALADRLRHLTPELGLGEIIEFFDQVGVGERSRGQLVALLPILESAFRTPGTSWTGRDELRRLVAIGESLTDGGANASIIEARLERAHRLAGDMATFFYLARTDPTTLNATVTGDADPDRPHGSYALLPEQLPPDGPALEDNHDWRDAEPKPFRRIAAGTIGAEQRARDEAARAGQE
jgi:hypothetical protein